MTLRDQINALCVDRLGRLPNLETPRGYNDKIQWLKLFDQHRDHITACDKFAVRARVPERHLLPARAVEGGRIPRDIPMPVIAKPNHDSGGGYVIRDEADAKHAERKLAPRLARTYGREKGEWAYQFIRPLILIEQLMPPPVVDYKFHCAHGRVMWVRVVWDRVGHHANEAIFLPDGTVTDMHQDHDMTHMPEQSKYPGDRAWSELTSLAEKLAQPWRHVRVDLYWSGGRTWFGELTFWPKAGCHLTPDDDRFGEMMDIDLTAKREPLIL